MRIRITPLLAAMTCMSAVACEAGPGFVPADRDFPDFQLVYPVLVRDCGFQTCHGAEERFFRIYGPGRSRLEEDTLAYADVTGSEISLSYSLAISMIDAEHPEDSLLLRKPLSIDAGGVSHGGNDRFGRNVYRTENDAGYLAIARFVFAEPEPEPEAE